MSRPKGIPKYRLHKQSGQAIVTLTDPLGGRKDVPLGKFGSKESKAEYVRVLAEWQANGQKPLAQNGPAHNRTVVQLINDYFQYVEKRHRKADGSPSSEVEHAKLSLRPLNFLHGNVPISDYGPMRLKAVRELMVKGYEHPKYGPQGPIARNTINRRVSRIRQMFRWAVENEMVSATVLHALEAVKNLEWGRSEARETEPVRPVALALVQDTMAAAPPMLADMIELQRLTGMRSGELVIMRSIDIDMIGQVWSYRPATHKTSYRGQERVVAIGPRGRAIIQKYLKTNLEAYLFSPREVREERFRIMRAKRQTKVQPSQVCRQKPKPRKKPGDRYTTDSYRRAVEYARCKAGVPHWHPHQLRHLCATEVRRQRGIDAAKAVLGHRSPAITEIYAELDQGKAAEVMAKIG